MEVFIQRSPKELMAATHIKCCKPRLREQIQLSIANSTSYIDIREKITSYERASKVWTNDQVLKHVNDQPNYASGSNDGPVPMEVDRVEKGKWKHKGKNKDRGSFGGSEWASGWLYGRGRGRGRTNKGKGKGKTKGEIKRKERKSKRWIQRKGGRSKVASGQCSNCMEFGHWNRDCPNMSAYNVAQKNSGRQELIPPNQTTPAAKSTATAAENLSVWRYTFQSFIPNFSYSIVSGAHGFIS